MHFEEDGNRVFEVRNRVLEDGNLILDVRNRILDVDCLGNMTVLCISRRMEIAFWRMGVASWRSEIASWNMGIASWRIAR